jgi:hypothetical protein
MPFSVGEGGTSGAPPAGSVDTEQLADGAVTVVKIGATGTPDETTFLRGNGVWATPAGVGEHDHDADYAAIDHNHDADYAAASHNHDGSYYTESEVDALLASAGAVNPGTAAGRLTASSTEAVPSSSQTAKTSIYYRRTGRNGRYLALYTSAAWHLRAVPENTEAVKVTTANTTGTTANGSPIITGISADQIEQLAVGMALTHGNFSGTPTISSMDATTVTMSGNATADGTPTDLVFKVPAETNFGIFAYWSVDKIRYRKLIWTDSTFGAGAAGYTLADQDGARVLDGAPEYLYIGKWRTTTTAGQTECSYGSAAVGGGQANVLGCNVYNRVKKTLFIRSTTDSYSYSTLQWRAAENSATYRAVVVAAEQSEARAFYAGAATTTVANNSAFFGIGVNSTTAMTGLPTTGQTTGAVSVRASAAPELAPGAHFITALESGAGGGTQTLYGDAGNANYYQTGLEVEIWF